MSSPAALQNIEVTRANDWIREYVVSSKQTDGTFSPMDLTGASVIAQAWDHEREFKYADFFVTMVDISNGKFKLKLTDDQTLHFPDELIYDVVIIDSLGDRDPYVRGDITVIQGVSR